MIRGNVRDRPWGKTLGALARRGVTGQLSLHGVVRDEAVELVAPAMFELLRSVQ